MEFDLSVLHVAPIWGDPSQGLTSAIQSLAEAQNDLCADVTLLSTADREPCGIQSPLKVLWARQLSTLEQERLIQDVDLVVFHSTYIWLHFRLSRMARRLGVPYVIVPHGGMTALAAGRSACKKWLADRLFYRRFVANACAIHYLTEGEAEASRHWQATGFVAGNGIVLPEISPEAGADRSRPLHFLFIGRLAVYPKGLDLLIEGLAMFLKSEPEAQLVLHIYGPSDDGSHLQLDALIREHRLEAYVELHSAVYAEEKVAVLNVADIFCHSSRFEGHPMAVLEALAYGLPCIASQGTNMADEIVASGAGWNAGETVEDVADAFSDAYHQGEQLLGYSIAARQMAEQYSWPERARCALSHYARLAKSN